MSSIMDAIHDDEEEYERLCQKFGEKAKYKKVEVRGVMQSFIDCYGEHAEYLKQKEQKPTCKTPSISENKCGTQGSLF